VPEQELDNEADLDKPITHVTRDEAKGFCDWLTEKEQATEIIDGEQRYRLPSDDEWSMAGNAPREIGTTPAERHLHVDGIYPWGFTMLPPASVANLFDKTAAAAENGTQGIANYDDHQATVAPVGTMKPDRQGRYDLSGNVWEWVADDYGGTDPTIATHGTARGGSWLTKERQETLTSFRRPVPANSRQRDVGFRILLSDGRPARADE
jgi:formylglycine-generating enzyme required for sulfatase activity